MNLRKVGRIMILPAALAAMTFSAGAQAGSADFGNFTLTYGGYVKLDALYSDYSDGNPSGGSIGRDWYVPSTTPVNGESEDGVLDMHAKQSRFFFATAADIGEHKVGSRFEFDFMLSPGGNERVSNSYNPRMRHAFITYDNWLFGQTWTTFQNPGALPDTVDFIGPSESTIFVRQAQVRYTSGPWAFALENPETSVYAPGGGALSTTDSNSLPDATARYNYTADWGNIYIAGLLRQLKIDDAATGSDDDDVGYGLSVSGKVNVFERDDIRFMASVGSGMGRYIGLNYAAGASQNLNGDISALDSWGAYAFYRHVWNDEWRSTIGGGYLDVDNDNAAGPTANKTASSIRANIIYSPIKQLSLGFELSYAKRELENNDDGDFTRGQFMAKYAF